MNEIDYTQFDKRFDADLAALKLGIRKAPKINSMERKILEFCAGRNMKEFLREEFEKHPIKLNENGNLIGENPFDKERREKGISEKYYSIDPLFDSIKLVESIDDVE